MLDKILSEPGRKALYGVAAAVAALLLTLGVVTPDSVDQWLDIIQRGIALLAAVVAALHVGAAPAAGRHATDPE